MTTSWRHLPYEEDAAAPLLARGTALLDSMADSPVATLRWYRSRDTALVLGRGQTRELVRDAHLTVVGRASGGGAVLMDPGLLCLDVVLPPGHGWLEGDLGLPFLRIGEAWAAALRELGVIDVEVHRGAAQARRRGSPREQLIAAICYATLGRGEVTAGGRKMVGLAQRRRRHGALVQCGLLRRWEPGRLLAALGADSSDEQIIGAAVGLDDLVHPPPTDDAVMAAVEHALERVEAQR